MMELHAAGFNAWNQLYFDSRPSEVTTDSEPDDISSFTRVLVAGDIRTPVSGLSYTLGMLPEARAQCLSKDVTGLVKPGL